MYRKVVKRLNIKRKVPVKTLLMKLKEEQQKLEKLEKMKYNNPRSSIVGRIERTIQQTKRTILTYNEIINEVYVEIPVNNEVSYRI